MVGKRIVQVQLSDLKNQEGISSDLLLQNRPANEEREEEVKQADEEEQELPGLKDEPAASTAQASKPKIPGGEKV